jgi:hypothetical protein
MHTCMHVQLFKPDPGSQWPMTGGSLTGQQSRENRADGISSRATLARLGTTAGMHERMCTGRIATFPTAVQSYARCSYAADRTRLRVQQWAGKQDKSDVDIARGI